MSSSRSRSRSRNRTEAPRLNNFNVTESSRMFGGSTTLNTNKPNPFDDDDSSDGGDNNDATAMFMKGGGNNKGNESKPNPFDDSSDHDGMIKAGQDTAQSSPDRNSPFDNKDNSPSSLGAASTGNSAASGNRVGPFNSPNNDNDDDEYNSNEEDEGPLTPQDIEEWHSNSQNNSPDDNAYHTADEDDKDDELGGGNLEGGKGEKKGYYNLSKPNEHSQFMSNQTGSGLGLSQVSEKSKESSDGSLNIQTHRTSSSINYGQSNDVNNASGNNNGSGESRRYSTKSSNISGIIDTDLTGISRGVEEGGGGTVCIHARINR